MKQDDQNEVEHILEETKEYYRQRASQYSDWTHKTSEWEQLDLEPEDSWFDDAQIVIKALESDRLVGDVLEIASGTGEWTEVLVKSAASVTALDSSERMIERNRSRLGNDPKVKYVLADFYQWTPDRLFDAVTFSFWISHVPGSKLDEFVSKVSQCLKPAGRVFFVDQRKEDAKYEMLEGSSSEIAKRTLRDGREFKIFKHFYSQEEIEECFLRNGIKATVTNTPLHFFYVSGEKIRSSSSS